MTLEEKVLALRLFVMRRAAELGNVSEACRQLGVSRTLFYRWRGRYLRYGADGLKPRPPRRARPTQQAPAQVEQAVLGYAELWPTHGPARIAQQLTRPGGPVVKLSSSGAYAVLRRHGLSSRWERLARTEIHAATSGLLTERTRAALQEARGAAPQHIEAARPGQLVCLDTFYIGQLKGVGKVWQITACDAACSYGVAWLLPAHTAEAAAHFLRRVLLPVYRRAGWRLRRVLTDGGPEFKGAFDEACRALGLRHTRTKPRHAWTNGFVERLQGTILQEHWRLAFRRRYFTSRTALQRSLEGFMQSYNHERPHQGYRVRGRTPAALFWGAARG